MPVNFEGLKVTVKPTEFEDIRERLVTSQVWPKDRPIEVGLVFAFVEMNRAMTIPTGRMLRCVIARTWLSAYGNPIVEFVPEADALEARRSAIETAPPPIVRAKPRWVWTPPQLLL